MCGARLGKLRMWLRIGFCSLTHKRLYEDVASGHWLARVRMLL